jgi:hypothetical protein
MLFKQLMMLYFYIAEKDYQERLPRKIAGQSVIRCGAQSEAGGQRPPRALPCITEFDG